MKSINSMANIAFSVFLIAFLFSSCKKESVSKPTSREGSTSLDESSEVIKTSALDTVTLALKPFAAGQDTYLTFWNGDATWANSTGDWAQELSMASWTNGGLLMGVRSFIRFDRIDLIPPGSTITSAKLFLYAKGSSISAPQGNSGDNACKVERVIGGQWNESTLTWNTQPSVTTVGAATIPASTSQWGYNVKINVLSMVKSMAANPSKNYGFRISLTNESPYRSMIFASSENSNPALRPKLVIQYK